MAPHSNTFTQKIPWTEECCSPRGRQSQTRLCNFTFTFHFHALEKQMATHSSVLAWRIPGTGSLVGAIYGVAQSRTRLKRLSSSMVRGSQLVLLVVYTEAVSLRGQLGSIYQHLKCTNPLAKQFCFQKFKFYPQSYWCTSIYAEDSLQQFCNRKEKNKMEKACISITGRLNDYVMNTHSVKYY